MARSERRRAADGALDIIAKSVVAACVHRPMFATLIGKVQVIGDYWLAPLNTRTEPRVRR